MRRSPLYAQLQAAQAEFTDYQGWEIPARFGPVEEEYRALKEAAGLVDLTYRGRIVVRGRDAPRFLHGMVTNEVRELEIGQGNYAFLLDVHGHVLADLRVLRLEAETFWLECEPQSSAVIYQALERHIIADVVELEDRQAQMACLGLEGPCAREILSEAIGFDPPQMHSLEHLSLEDLPVRLVRASLIGGDGYGVFCYPDQLVNLWRKIVEAGAALGLRPVGFQALEVCRIEAGIPRYGADITEKTLPQETGQMQAISFTKGCYIGQEVVERIRSRGHVNRKLVGLFVEGPPDLPPGTPLLLGTQPVGTLASSAYSFSLRRSIALGYVRREYAEPGTLLTAGAHSAELTELPFPTPFPESNSGSLSV